MLQKIRWLWKQFNGEFIAAWAVGVWRLVATLDATLIYFNTLSIDSANDAHLTLIGLMRGFTRTIIQKTSETYFYFTKNPEHHDEHGVSDGLSLPGGQFIDLNDPQYTNQNVLTPAEMYRRELQQANVDKGAANGSLIQICNLLNWGGRTNWKIDWYQHGDMNNTRTEGDIHIQVADDCWGSNTLAYRDALEGTIRNMVGPMRMVDIELVGDIEWEPETGVVYSALFENAIRFKAPWEPTNPDGVNLNRDWFNLEAATALITSFVDNLFHTDSLAIEERQQTLVGTVYTYWVGIVSSRDLRGDTLTIHNSSGSYAISKDVDEPVYFTFPLRMRAFLASMSFPNQTGAECGLFMYSYDKRYYDYTANTVTGVRKHGD